jgi:hypothetical protein
MFDPIPDWKVDKPSASAAVPPDRSALVDCHVAPGGSAASANGLLGRQWLAAWAGIKSRLDPSAQFLGHPVRSFFDNRGRFGVRGRIMGDARIIHPRHDSRRRSGHARSVAGFRSKDRGKIQCHILSPPTCGFGNGFDSCFLGYLRKVAPTFRAVSAIRQTHLPLPETLPKVGPCFHK